MEIRINTEKPLTMHIDLNSCFATIEQQANPLLRGKVMVVAAYGTENGCILAPSIEAKRYGIKTGMRIKEARYLYPDLIIRTPDSAKYRDVHLKFKKIFQDYSPNVYPKSIDEAIIDFRPTQALFPDLLAIGGEIKQRIKDEIGEWIVCSIGIAPNRFLAKLGASIHKPDGLTMIDHTNLMEIYASCELLDFCGINTRYLSRLNSWGIYTPLDFFNASSFALHKQVFKSVVGSHWYNRMRGYEVDDTEFEMKSIGQQYALQKHTNDSLELSRLLMKLCEKMGRRLRYSKMQAHGIHVGVRYQDYSYWHHGEKVPAELYTTAELYKRAWKVLCNQPNPSVVSLLSVHCFDLTPAAQSQLELFNEQKLRHRQVSNTVDQLNDMYGEFVVTPATMMKMNDTILDRIAFGRIRELENGFFS
jgi:DNA polymerase IV